MPAAKPQRAPSVPVGKGEGVNVTENERLNSEYARGLTHHRNRNNLLPVRGKMPRHALRGCYC